MFRRPCLCGCVICVLGVMLPPPLLAAGAGPAPESVASTTTTTSGQRLETITVFGERLDEPNRVGITAERMQHGQADAARLMALLPGADANENGALSGQVQYRGLFGPRMDIRVNGMRIPAGGPNWMAPPLHYVPTGLLHSIDLRRGIAGANSEGIGGHVDASWKQPAYSDGGWQPVLDLDASARSVDRGHQVAGLIGLASASQRFAVTLSDEAGDDYRAASGRVRGTGFDREAWGLAYGFTTGAHSLDLGYHWIDTGATGTPSLPLDIEFFDTDLWHGSYRYDNGSQVLTLLVAGSSVDHGMNNYDLRPAPDFSSLPLPPFVGDDKRRALASTDGYQVRVGFSTPLAGGIWDLGAEFSNEQDDTSVFDPDFEPFFVDNFVDTAQDSSAVFSNWEGDLTDRNSLNLGLRLARVETDSGAVDAFPARLVDMNPGMWPPGTPPRAVWALRERFNAADRSLADNLVDWMVTFSHEFSSSLKAEIGIARKSRAPVYQERYLWIPLEINAGLGDGNNYVGDLNLKPEVSHQLELGLTWSGGRGYLTPRIYYREVNDYIQGTASTDPLVIAVSANANGDPTPMQFANVDARLYGIDLGFGLILTDSLRLDGNAAYVRGERRDVHDNLFRVAPPNLRLALSWRRGPLKLTLEQLAVARLDKLSRTLTLDPANPHNSFTEVSGYSVTSLYGSYRVSGAMTLTLGVENLLDKAYTDPLSGFNRNDSGSVAVGQRQPGRGINAFGRLRYQLN